MEEPADIQVTHLNLGTSGKKGEVLVEHDYQKNQRGGICRSEHLSMGRAIAARFHYWVNVRRADALWNEDRRGFKAFKADKLVAIVLIQAS